VIKLIYMLDNAITSSFSAETANALVASLAQTEPPAIANKPKAQPVAKPKTADNLVWYDEIRSKDRMHLGRKREGEVLQGAKAQITVGKSIRIFGTEHNHRLSPLSYDLTFKIGDEAVYGGRNIKYTGKITKIGPKTVTIADDHHVKQCDLYTFIEKNWNYNAARIAKHNLDWLD